jgi:hypothetical protein
VISPKSGEGARYSIPFFQGVSYDASFQHMDVPDHVRELRKDILEREGGRKDDVEFTFVKGRWNHLGEATLMNRIKSHPDVGERWYPELLQRIRKEQQEAAAAAATATASLQHGTSGTDDETKLDGLKQPGKAIKAH